MADISSLKLPTGVVLTLKDASARTRLGTAENSIASLQRQASTASTNINALDGRLTSVEEGKAPIASPTFTGTPKAPTPATETNNTQIATTAFVKQSISASFASPAFSGTPKAPTADVGTDNTQIATTAFVKQAINANIDSTLAVSGKSPDSKATGDAINAVRAALNKEISYYSQQNVTTGTSSQIMRIPASGTSSFISENTVVLECVFANPAAITSDVTWTSYSGYIVFSGTCTAATTANVTLGTKNN